jgi:hypothetical protein
MLCDQLANITYPDIVAMTPGLSDFTRRWTMEGFDNLRPLIKGAHKFVLDDSVAAACEHIRQGRPTSIQAAMEFAAVPFPVTWVEWAGNAVSGTRHLRGGTSVPRRVGMLLDTSDPRAGSAHLFWSMPAPLNQLRVSPAMVMFDFTRTIIPQMRREMFPEIKHEVPTADELRELMPHKAKWLNQPAEVEALANSGDDGFLMPSTAVMGSLGPKLTAEAGVALTKEAQSDWEGEVGFLKAVLIMMNCRNAVESEAAAEQPRLNRKRALAGKLPLFEHRVIRMKLRGPERRGTAGTGEGGRMRAHLVRGHFKVRKTGVFFWTPFVRGDALLGTIRSRYEVRL